MGERLDCAKQGWEEKKGFELVLESRGGGGKLGGREGNRLRLNDSGVQENIRCREKEVASSIWGANDSEGPREEKEPIGGPR